MNPDMRSRFQGCLIGGAVGDALGAPVEFMNYGEIVRKFGPDGIKDYVPGVVRRNPRNFRQPSSSPATSASRSMNLPSVWKV